MSAADLIFMDAWDNYSVIVQNWNGAGTDCAIDLTGTKSRTGIGCLTILSAAFGPSKNFTQRTHLIFGSACFIDKVPAGFAEIFRFNYLPTNDSNLRVILLADGSIKILASDDGAPVVQLGVTAANIFQFSQYNYIEVKAYIAAAPLGSVQLFVNGVSVLLVTGVQTYVNGGTPFVTNLQLMGPGGNTSNCYYDDTYMAEWSGANTDVWGPVRLYAFLPNADSTPLDWSVVGAASNYLAVNEVPPDSDTSYVSSATVGNVDQYAYPITGPSQPATVIAAQHNLLAKIDSAGARSIASDVSGVVGPSVALTTDYAFVQTPYMTNPHTGSAWHLADFSTGTVLGPKLTV